MFYNTGIHDLFNNLNFLKSIAYFVSIAGSGKSQNGESGNEMRGMETRNKATWGMGM